MLVLIGTRYPIVLSCGTLCYTYYSAVEMIYFPDFAAVSSIILAIISVALFMLSFESKKPSVANLVPTAVFSALGAAGKIAAPLAYVSLFPQLLSSREHVS